MSHMNRQKTHNNDRMLHVRSQIKSTTHHLCDFLHYINILTYLLTYIS